jgi:hypothetical protein
MNTTREDLAMQSIARILFAALAFQVVACGSSSKNASATKVSLGTAPADTLTVELLTDNALETGLTPIYVKVTTSGGQAVTDATVTFVPLMSMSSGMQHSAPVLDQPAIAPDGLYHGSVVFQMASSTMGAWSATVGVTQPGADPVEASFAALPVIDSGRSQVFTYTDPVSAMASKYVSSLNFTASPKIGLNPIVFTLHRMQDMMTFVPVNDATLVLDPEMPSMGHGSPDSVDPTLTASGRYEGSLSFSMTGLWETTVTVSEAGVVLGAPVFTTNF